MAKARVNNRTLSEELDSTVAQLHDGLDQDATQIKALQSNTNITLSDLTIRILAMEQALSATTSLVHFDQTTQTMTIRTSSGQTIVLNDQDHTMALRDESGNVVTLSRTGITMNSPYSISLQADRDITSGAKGNILFNAAQDATCQATNISLAAAMTMSAKGSATAEVSASGELI